MEKFIDWAKDGIIQNWVVWLISAVGSILVSCLFYGLLYAFGKEAQVKPERRKWFFGIGSVIAFLGLLALQHFNHQLEDIRSASPHQGGLHASVISMTQ